jgi:hypothetical protein
MTQFNSTPPSTTPSPSQQPNPQMLMIAQLLRRASSGATNFYWIAALSVINSIVSVFGGGMYFVVGLAMTLLVDGFFLGAADALPDAKLVVQLIGLAISVVVSAFFAMFGYFAGKGKRWAFITGIVLYALDTLLMVVFQEWLGLLFHVFFLWGLFNGLRALNQLQKFLPQKPSDFPQSIGVS